LAKDSGVSGLCVSEGREGQEAEEMYKQPITHLRSDQELEEEKTKPKLGISRKGCSF